MLRVLDLFCGRGGWSKGFAKCGATCTGIDMRKFAGYPYDFIRADLNDYMPTGKYDVILASPPCTQFSHVNMIWNGKSNESKGLELVYRTFHIINTLKPTYWAMENVKHLQDFIGPPRAVIRYGSHKNTKSAYLWGNFPDLSLLNDARTSTGRHTYKKDPTALGEIPLFVSEGLARAITAQLMECRA